MNERLKFVAAGQRGDQTLADICREFGINKMTGYEPLFRYERAGTLASRAHCPETGLMSIPARETCWTLIRAASAGGPNEQEEFGRRYLPTVHAYLTARWRNTPLRNEVDDGVQEVFVACFRENGALQRTPEGSSSSSFRAFLFGVVRNIALHMERTHARRSARHAAALGSQLPHDDPSLSRLFDRHYARELMRQTAELMSRRANSADEAARRRVELLTMRFENGLPIREIATRWKVDPASLHNEYAKAGREFRSALREVVGLAERCAPDALDRECERLLALMR